MGRSQTFYPADLDDMVRWVAGLASPGARVLDIGCGDGEVVRRLRALGLDAVGIDPGGHGHAHGDHAHGHHSHGHHSHGHHAHGHHDHGHAHADVPPPPPYVRAVALEDLDDAPFDVLFASVSLHHVHDPAAATAALRRLSRPGTRLAIREFDRVRLDHEPTLRWWFHQRHALAAVGIREDDEDFTTDFAAFVTGWRAKMAEHVHPWSTVEAAVLAAGFTIDSLAWGPYLFRWGLSELVRPLEEALIASGHLRPIGLRCLATRAT